jgi:ParB family transcriptional regulator, chromosome partitioning protein
VHALAQDIFLGCHNTVLELAGRTQSLKLVEGSAAFQRLEQARESWGQRIPGTHDGLWQWCLEQDQSILLDLLTFCAACMVNAVQRKADTPDSPRLGHARNLSLSLNFDMKAWFIPTADNYFSRVSKPQILDALAAARHQPPAPAWEKLKKAELAAIADREIAGTGWLPDILR